MQTKEGAFTLSAMTSGIRRNWIQTIMKHVHPATAPDVTRCAQGARHAPLALPCDLLLANLASLRLLGLPTLAGSFREWHLWPLSAWSC